MTEEQAIKGLKENLCSLCAYGSQNMDSCDIRKCDNRDYFKALERKSSDCVSREAVFETIDDCNSDGLKGIFCSYDDGERFKEYIKKLPPVTPTHGTCKDCVHRDPEDKKCDCGHSIEWQTPRPDDWYCADFEKRGSENDEANVFS